MRFTQLGLFLRNSTFWQYRGILFSIQKQLKFELTIFLPIAYLMKVNPEKRIISNCF